MDEQRQLQSFLRWLFILAAVCNAAYYLLALALDDQGLWKTGLACSLFLAGVIAAGFQAKRGKTSSAAAIVALSILATILAVLPVFAYAWPTLALASILAVAIVLPYVERRALGVVVVASFVVATAVSLYGSFAMGSPTPPSLTQRSVLLATKIAVTSLLLLLLAQFVKRLRSTLAETMSAFQSEQSARARAERLAEQTRRLQGVTSQLSRALPPGDIAQIVLEQGIGISGADTGALWIVDGAHLTILRAVGYPDSVLEQCRVLTLDNDSPIVDCALHREPIWPEPDPDQLSMCCLPLQTEDRVVGVIGYSFLRPLPLDEADRALLETLSHHCAQALETVRLLEQEREAREMARAADTAKDEFLALLGHELRNPLAPIATAIEVMKLRGASDRELPILERQVRHLIGLVDDLLDVSRVTRGKIRLERKRIDLATAIDDAVEMTAPLMEKKSHALSIVAPREKLWVDADPRRLAQVIANLLTNAARYTEPGGKIRLLAEKDQEDRAAVTVEDNGHGIDPALIESLFEPFAQGEQSIDRSSGGLGLGLMLVKSLTELHGGAVEVHSDGIGRGSRFTVRFPQAFGNFDEEQTPVWLPPLDGGLRHRVLIVDDNRDAANTLGELLETYGCDVAVAFDGPSALEVASAFDPSVAILDIGLPVMDGYELCERLRQRLGEKVRMLSLSGYGQEEDRGKSAEAGFVAHLVKPIDATALMAALGS